MVRRILFKGVAVLTAATVAIAALTGGQAWLETSETVSAQATSTITGTVYRDAGIDGVFASSDSGVEGVTVSAYNSSGAKVAETTTGADGTYTLTFTNLHLGTVRVEFETPQGWQPTIISEGSLSSIQFVEPGSTGVDYGIFDPNEDCALSVAHVCFREGPLSVSSTSRVLGISPFSGPTTGNPPKMVGDPGNNLLGQTIPDDVPGLITSVATKAQVGATWGLAVDPEKGLLWNSAVIRRHTALADKGVGGVYVLNREGDLVTSFDLEALGLNLRPTAGDLGLAAAFGEGATTSGKVLLTDAARDITGITTTTTTGITGTTYNARSLMALSRDIPAFAAVGKAGIGDIDLSIDGQYLWVSNLGTRSIHRFPVGGTASVPTLGTPETWLLDDGYTCATGTGPFRGWGLDPQPDGTVVAAGVCTNESATPSQNTGPGLGAVLRLDPTATTSAAAWEVLTAVDFSYEHVYDLCDHVFNSPRSPLLRCSWKSWTSDFEAIKDNGRQNTTTDQMWWTQPIIMDIATLEDGSFALGINDRFSYMASSQNYRPLDVDFPDFMTAYTAGGLRLLCKTESGWAQEDDRSCLGITNYVSANTATWQPDSFFRNDFQGAHPATAMGALAYANGVLAYAAMDAASYFSSGVRWVSTEDGSQINALTTSGEYGKASGVGDLEAFCDVLPLQIGNYVWYDLNNNGIQDPDELPVVGVTVRLYNASTGALVGTAVTNSRGEYYFTSSTIEPAGGGTTPDEFGGGLVADTPYRIVMDLAADCAAGAPLDGFSLTLTDATTSAETTDRDDRIDNDATSMGANSCLYNEATVIVAPMSLGTVDHTYDIGFYRPSVIIGDLVWFDLNKNGVQDPGEPGVANVVLTITTAAGGEVTDIFGRKVTSVTTSASGRYLIPFLPAGAYKITITLPGDYETTTGTSEVQMSLVLALGADVRTLDFGIYSETEAANFPAVPPSGNAPPGEGPVGESVTTEQTIKVSIGDYVWWDTNADGRQDETDIPLEGVVLRIYTVDGGPVVDVFGNPVVFTTTNAQGWYTFDNLPPGQYRVEIEAPEGFVPTLANVGSTDGDSSTSFAVSRILTEDQERDPTLDFGFIPVGTQLPKTGSDAAVSLQLSLLLIVAGSVLLVRTRRRQLAAASLSR
jgi:LPXTG-motif cell wall-anchored protein